MRAAAPLLFVLAWFTVGGFIDLLLGQRAVLFMAWSVLGMVILAYWWEREP